MNLSMVIVSVRPIAYSGLHGFGIRVRTGPGNPGKSWNFIIAFSRTGKSWKSNAGPGKSWKSVKLNKVIKFSLKQMSKVFLVFL